MNLDPADQAILAFVRTFLGKHHYSPSVREIAEGVGYASTNSTQIRLAKLEHMGYIRRNRNVARSITLRKRPTTPLTA